MKEEFLKLKIRIDDLIMDMAMCKVVNPELYYELLPHFEKMKEKLKPWYKRLFK